MAQSPLAELIATERLRQTPPRARLPGEGPLQPYALEFGRGVARAILEAPGDLVDLILGAQTAGAPMSAAEAAAPLPNLPMVPVRNLIPALRPEESLGLPGQIAGLMGEVASPDPLDLVKSMGVIGTLAARFPEIAAYHGSPHKFARFSTDKIGTGEGAQAYGWGLYFSDKKGVAKSYRDALTKGRSHTKGAIYKVELAPDDDDLLDWDLPLREQSEKVKSKLKKNGLMEDNKINTEWEETVDPYHPENKAFKTMVYDKDRAPSTRFQVAEVFQDVNTNLWNGYVDGEFIGVDAETADKAIEQAEHYMRHGRINGKELYRSLGARGEYGKKDREASEFLNSIGIPGIRYKDQLSRGKKGGSYNYVIFDDKLIDILESE